MNFDAQLSAIAWAVGPRSDRDGEHSFQATRSFARIWRCGRKDATSFRHSRVGENPSFSSLSEAQKGNRINSHLHAQDMSGTRACAFLHFYVEENPDTSAPYVEPT